MDPENDDDENDHNNNVLLVQYGDTRSREKMNHYDDNGWNCCNFPKTIQLQLVGMIMVIITITVTITIIPTLVLPPSSPIKTTTKITITIMEVTMIRPIIECI